MFEKTAKQNFVFNESLRLSEELAKIGYFDLIKDQNKLTLLKQKIDLEYNDNSNAYIGRGWLNIPNDGYLSAVNNLEEYENNKSSSSDFRAFQVDPMSLFRGCLDSYLDSAKSIFEKNGLTLQWKDEDFNQDTKENHTYHKVTINGKDYFLYDGESSKFNRDQVMSYVAKFKEILTHVAQEQNENYSILAIACIERLDFILLESNMKSQLKEILRHTKNDVED